LDSRNRRRSGAPVTTTVSSNADNKKAVAPRAKKTRCDSTRHGLTAKEEQVLRMRYGIAASPEMKIRFEGQECEETRRKIAEIEHRALEMILAKRAAASDPSPPKLSTKDKIINKLRKL